MNLNQECKEDQIKRIETSILLIFGHGTHSDVEIITLLDEEEIYVQEALESLVKKGLLTRDHEVWYSVPFEVQQEVYRLSWETLFSSKLLKQKFED